MNNNQFFSQLTHIYINHAYVPQQNHRKINHKIIDTVLPIWFYALPAVHPPAYGARFFLRLRRCCACRRLVSNFPTELVTHL